MSHTNTTTNYGLPQFLSSDKPAWMADINVAFADIDSQMKTNADAASASQTTADDAVLNGAPGYSNLSTYAVGDVVNYLGRVYKCDIAVTTPEAFDNAKWSYYRLSDASAQLDVIDGEIGNTDISGIGDGTITGAISNVNSDLSSKADASWNHVDTKTGLVSITLPNDYNELLIVIKYGSHRYSVNVPHDEVTANNTTYRGGFYVSAANNDVYAVDIIDGFVGLNSFYANNTNASSSTSVSVYSR